MPIKASLEYRAFWLWTAWISTGELALLELWWEMCEAVLSDQNAPWPPVWTPKERKHG